MVVIARRVSDGGVEGLPNRTRGFDEAERTHWEQALEWQGFRELSERALVAWDWGEQFIALNFVLKSAIDAAFIGALGQAARRNDDTLTGLLLDVSTHR